MPSVFVSPSTQEYNLYVTGNSEEYYMNLVADAMEPYLNASGISFSRNDPALTVGGSVNLSNAGTYDVHLALHSNAAPESLSGRIQGTDVYYYQGSASGEALAQLIAANMRTIYPYPELVGTTPTRNLYELNNTATTAVLVEVAYHDNQEDAEWIISHINDIARIMVLSLTQYFGIPFVVPNTVQRGVVDTEGFSVSIRSEPSFAAPTVGTVPNGANVLITGTAENWYIIDYNGMVGYINQSYITLI
ncbi:MAG: N-acetylmuramoyl-L-alanine amidase [Firmicutes bacterium]|nr:N-acetylmuramoyl-L-alanine amidase [Bacillota bacterium]